MTDIWTYRPDIERGAADVTGYDVEATDGHIGKVDEATWEAGASYVVVDTGFWIFGKRRMIPAASIQQVDPETSTVWLSLTKDQVKEAPDYDEARATEREYRDELTTYYGQWPY